MNPRSFPLQIIPILTILKTIKRLTMTSIHLVLWIIVTWDDVSQDTCGEFWNPNVITHCSTISSVQSLSCVPLFVMPWTAAYQASLSIVNSQSLLKLMSIESVMPVSSSVIPFSSCLQSFPASGSFPMSQFFAVGGQSIGVSASASVLPTNIQDWFPLGFTGWITLQSKGLSRVFSNTRVQKHQFLALGFLYSPTLTSIPDYWKNHSFD